MRFGRVVGGILGLLMRFIGEVGGGKVGWGELLLWERNSWLLLCKGGEASGECAEGILSLSRFEVCRAGLRGRRVSQSDGNTTHQAIERTPLLFHLTLHSTPTSLLNLNQSSSNRSTSHFVHLPP